MFNFRSLFIIALALCVLGLSADTERSQRGSLIKVRGDVKIRIAGSDRWTTAHERMGVGQGDRIKTGANGEAIVRISPRNTMTVRPNSEIEIKIATVRTEGTGFRRSSVQNIEVDLTAGRSVNILRGLGKGSNFRVTTPVAVAGVRGTVFMAGITPAGLWEFACSEGIVSIMPLPGAPVSFRPVDLGPGQFVLINPAAMGPSSSGPEAMPPMITLEIQTIETATTTTSGDQTTTTSTQQETSSTEATTTTNTSSSSSESSQSSSSVICF